MFIQRLSSLGLVLAWASAGLAGDDATINLPGGAMQPITTSAFSSDINSFSGANIVAGGGSAGVIAEVNQNVSTGAFTITTIGGQAYIVSSTFISELLFFYD